MHFINLNLIDLEFWEWKFSKYPRDRTLIYRIDLAHIYVGIELVYYVIKEIPKLLFF